MYGYNVESDTCYNKCVILGKNKRESRTASVFFRLIFGSFAQSVKSQQKFVSW